ncbi:hypothetical protein ANN_17139, partial [Periplaneta americana]
NEKARASKPAGVRLECASASASASEGLSSSAVDRSWRDLSSSAVDRSWRDPSSIDINTVFKSSHVQKHTRLKVYKTLARPVLTYGSEAWTIRKADEQRLTTAEMRFMRRTAGCSLLEHRKNVDILQELKMDPIVNFVQQYRLQWKKHVKRMDRTRWPKQILTYVPRGKRKLGRPRKRLHETVTDPVGSNT